MAILIDLGLPKQADEMIELAVFGDGRVVKTGESWRSPEDGKCYYRPSGDMNAYKAIEVHEPHGDLIDREELQHIIGQFSLNWEYGQGVSDCWDALLNAPTVIPASEVG